MSFPSIPAASVSVDIRSRSADSAVNLVPGDAYFISSESVPSLSQTKSRQGMTSPVVMHDMMNLNFAFVF
jgi:hypothetical protein